MALRKALHCAVDGEDDEGSKHHFPLGLHNENNREHAASGVNSSSLFIRWSAQLRQPFLCAPSSANGTRLPHHSPNQTERGGHRLISYLSAYGFFTLTIFQLEESMLSYRSHLRFRPAPLRLVYSYEGSQRYTWPRIHGCRGRYVPRCYESKARRPPRCALHDCLSARRRSGQGATTRIRMHI